VVWVPTADSRATFHKFSSSVCLYWEFREFSSVVRSFCFWCVSVIRAVTKNSAATRSLSVWSKSLESRLWWSHLNNFDKNSKTDNLCLNQADCWVRDSVGRMPFICGYSSSLDVRSFFYFLFSPCQSPRPPTCSIHRQNTKSFLASRLAYKLGKTFHVVPFSQQHNKSISSLIAVISESLTDVGALNTSGSLQCFLNSKHLKKKQTGPLRALNEKQMLESKKILYKSLEYCWLSSVGFRSWQN
jgi:hypothetical protein